MMFEAFSPEHTMAAFGWVDAELSALSVDASFAPWWAQQVETLSSRLPSSMTGGRTPKPVPDEYKSDLSKFVLVQELFFEVTHGPPGGIEISIGNSDGVLPPLEGGWGLT